MRDQTDYKRNYIRAISFEHVPKDDIVERLNYISQMLEPHNEGSDKEWLGEYYYYKYLSKLASLAKETIDRAYAHIKLNNLKSDDKSHVEWPILKLKNLVKNTETSPPYIKKEDDKQEVELRDFFIEKVSNETIAELQRKFKDLRGKEMAILIHLLNERKIVVIDNNDRKYRSRLPFVKKFTGNRKLKRIDSVNKYLDYDNNFKNINVNDPKYIQTKDKLEKVVSSR